MSAAKKVPVRPSIAPELLARLEAAGGRIEWDYRGEPKAALRGGTSVFCANLLDYNDPDFFLRVLYYIEWAELRQKHTAEEEELRLLQQQVRLGART